MTDIKGPRHIALAVLTLAVSVACGTSKVATIPGMDMTTKLHRADYVVLGTATGQACAEESCLFFSCTKKASVAGEELLDGRSETESLRDVRTATVDLGPLALLFGAPGGPGQGKNIAKSIAMYKAIESIPDADAMLSPRFEIDTTEDTIPFITRNVKSCVTVKGKAVHIKSDAEMAASR